jgi:uncharacterized protein
MKHYFLDSSFVIAAGLARDQNHTRAASMWPLLLKSGVQLITTTFIFEEAVTFFNGKGEHALAVHFGNVLLSSKHVELLPVEWDLFDSAWTYFKQHEDKKYSFIDCMSFVVMKRENIAEALTFDGHFAQAGFALIP